MGFASYLKTRNPRLLTAVLWLKGEWPPRVGEAVKPYTSWTTARVRAARPSRSCSCCSSTRGRQSSFEHEQYRSSSRLTPSSLRVLIWTGCKHQPLECRGVSQEEAGAPAPGEVGGERPGGPTLPPSGPSAVRPGEREQGDGATSSVGEVASPGTHEAAGEGPISPGETRPPLARKWRVKEEPSPEEEEETHTGRDRRRRRDSGERRERERTRTRTSEAAKAKKSEQPKPSRREEVFAEEDTKEEKDRAVASDPAGFGLKPTSKPSPSEPQEEAGPEVTEDVEVEEEEPAASSSAAGAIEAPGPTGHHEESEEESPEQAISEYDELEVPAALPAPSHGRATPTGRGPPDRRGPAPGQRYRGGYQQEYNKAKRKRKRNKGLKKKARDREFKFQKSLNPRWRRNG